MRVIVAGGRTFQNLGFVFEKLDELHSRINITTLIHGGARGVDSFAGEWCKSRLGIDPVVFPAKWNTYKLAAGPMRNQQMIDEGFPDLVVLFPGNNGTRDMGRRARVANIPIIEYEKPVSIENLI